MARPLRIERVGGWYHVTARGNERRAIYRDIRDRVHFLELVEQMVERFRLRVHTYVLMENHYHLLVELREACLSRALQWLNTSYSVWFNRRHQRAGHLFQGRFKSVVVSRESWGLALSRYIHLNPVRIEALGLGKVGRQRSRHGVNDRPTAEQVARRIALLRGYRWSSYRAYIGLERVPAWLECEEVHALGGSSKEGQRSRRYREYVEMEIREGMKESPWESLRDQIVLGSQEFLEELRKQGTEKSESARKRLERMASPRPDWAAVVDCVEHVKGEKWEVFRDRHGDRGREMVLHLARERSGMTLAELARRAGLKSDSSVAISLRRYTKRLLTDPKERAQLARATQMLIVSA